ncbi:MAG: hypothetical protein NTU41_10405 [Chloroflexi bacterium]|nr:hypothetical protein [Chloroflexota bacterium]
MKVDFAFICDYANAAGKINALGIGFDTIYAPTLPARHPMFFFVMQFRASVVEVGEKKLEVHLIDEDGNEVIPPLKASIDVRKPSTGMDSVNRVAMQFGNVEFKRYCSCSLRATLDGHEMAAVDLKVAAPPKSASGNNPPPG